MNFWAKVGKQSQASRREGKREREKKRVDEKDDDNPGLVQ